METRANYALIGGFTLGIIGAAFLFVFWFSGAGRPVGRMTYKVVFTGSISGLSRGGWVLFNGVRVGEVSSIELVPQDPSRVSALIDIDANVPVRSDTKASLEYTGFTGVASIALKGGATQAPPLPKEADGGPGVLMADRSQFQDLLETAQRIAGKASDFLDKSNSFIDDSSGPLNKSVKNVEKFSDALAANADGVKDFMASMSDIGKTIKPLTVKLQELAQDTDGVVKAVDPAQVKAIVKDFAGVSAKLNAAADKVDTVLTNLNGLLATGDSKGMFGDISDAAKSIRRLADDFDVRTREIIVNLTRFTNTGLKQYEALAVDGRKTLDEINEAVRSIESNPTQFIFGKKTSASAPAATPTASAH
jgi:phospholipid/cholesterol/gamma-HCH transport system substrate-binding protein